MVLISEGTSVLDRAKEYDILSGDVLLNYVNLPIMIKYQLPLVNRSHHTFGVFMNAGAQVSVLTKELTRWDAVGSYTSTTTTQWRWQGQPRLGLLFGGGFFIDVARKCRLTLEYRGNVNYTDLPEHDTDPIRYESEGLHISSESLSVGLVYTR